MSISPAVTFTRNTFFLLLAVLCLLPTFIWKMIWLARTTVTTGQVWFTGHTLEVNGSISNHLVVLFTVGKDSIQFNESASLPYKEGDAVPVRYQPGHPSDARVDRPSTFWRDALLNGLWPLSVLLIIYLIPERFDPIIPRRSKIRLSRKRVVEVIPG
ncbi:DUF3592 domain-containing protein [Paraflavitalea pollutisoli]|uniref:DUF3592 domain-containing protein n=1 Tax=Paraflavitalea pollutisoli TaxID=3034143 RepID=UPI0023EC8ADF|nr:DUF3592 domain-containing protein [Paraflavitalea sp. H1-2-19X]